MTSSKSQGAIAAQSTVGFAPASFLRSGHRTEGELGGYDPTWNAGSQPFGSQTLNVGHKRLNVGIRQARSHTMSQTGTNTERAIRDFVRHAVSHLSEALKEQAPEWDIEPQWERGTDGHFRERNKPARRLWRIPNLYQSAPGYDGAVQCLKSDPIIGRHLDRLVGTDISARRMEADDLLWSMIYAMLDDEGALAFMDERFNRKWQELIDFFGAQQVAVKTVAPLPHLRVAAFPLRLNSELVLDRLTEDEVTRCCEVGVLRPVSQRFRLISADVAVGIRKTISMPKVVQTGDESHALKDATDEGSFGGRPILRDDLVVDDVLSALRLFKRTHIRAAGHASWADSSWVASGTSFRALGQWPYGGDYELSENEISPFLELWNLLEDGAGRFGFGIHRFNLAFDRRLLADRIVDLVIAAESLFLSDLGVQDRGELRFRCALRAAKFIEHPLYGERDVYRLMRRAYDARSSIVHGGSPKSTSLPDDEAAKLPAFTDAIEELVRLGLRKALGLKEGGKKLRTAEYWEELLLGGE